MTIRLPDELLERLRRMATAERRTVQQQMLVYIEAGVKQAERALESA